MSIKFTDHSADVLQQFERNKAKAANAVGIKAVGLIVRNMQSGYGKPIRKTGDLMRDVSYDVVDDNTVNVGNTLDYSLFVHEGTRTRKMAARHYITDALTTTSGKTEIAKTYTDNLSEGFE